jgi:hypothetical protein
MVRLIAVCGIALGGCVEQNPDWLGPRSDGGGSGEGGTSASTGASATATTTSSAGTATVGTGDDPGSSSELDTTMTASDTGSGAGHHIFLSTTFQDGAFGGIAGGDAICARSAAGAGLSGTWLALVSTSDLPVRDRIDITGPVRDMQGNPVAEGEDDLFDGMLGTIPGLLADGSEPVGQQVWTGTLALGTVGMTCGDWTLGGMADFGMTGNGGFTNELWTELGDDRCFKNFRIYCISQ